LHSPCFRDKATPEDRDQLVITLVVEEGPEVLEEVVVELLQIFSLVLVAPGNHHRCQ
jgi:hypothetical protein